MNRTRPPKPPKVIKRCPARTKFAIDELGRIRAKQRVLARRAKVLTNYIAEFGDGATDTWIAKVRRQEAIHSYFTSMSRSASISIHLTKITEKHVIEPENTNV